MLRGTSIKLYSSKFLVVILPTIFFCTSIIMRDNAGPFWLWSNLDPDYAYLLDSLNMINSRWPQEMAHPGITLDLIGAIIIKGLHPFLSKNELTRLVLTEPEHYLQIIAHALITLNTIGLIALGFVTFSVFKDWIPVVLMQMAPFLSKLIFKWSLHVAPEPLLLTTVICLSTVTILSLRHSESKNLGYHYIVAFSFLCGFGLTTKLTSLSIYLLPIFLLGNFRLIFIYIASSVFFISLLALPAAGSLNLVIDQIITISSAVGHHGHGASGFIDFQDYPKNLIRVSSRPIFFLPLLVGFFLLIISKWRYPKQYDEKTWRALAGYCLACFLQAIVVAKHPSGHYMIPALALAGLGLTLIYSLLKSLLIKHDGGVQKIRYFFGMFLFALSINQCLTIKKLNDQFVERAFIAQELDEKKYKKCAKIYVWSASNAQYGLFFGSWNTKGSFTDELSMYYPDKTIMYMINDGKLYDFSGARQISTLHSDYQCIFVRGAKPDQSIKALAHISSNYKIKGACKIGAEKVITWGIKC